MHSEDLWIILSVLDTKCRPSTLNNIHSHATSRILAGTDRNKGEMCR